MVNPADAAKSENVTRKFHWILTGFAKKWLMAPCQRAGASTENQYILSNEKPSRQQWRNEDQNSSKIPTRDEGYSGFLLFYWQKIKDYSRTFQDPYKKFSRTFLEAANV